MKTTTALETVICADCGAPCIPDGCATGYAIMPDGRKICYVCADRKQREDLKDRSKPFCAYVRSDGNAITTWTGGTLMTVVESRPCKLSRISYTHDRNSFRSIRAKDVHGGFWHGRGSAGICIKLRPCAA